MRRSGERLIFGEETKCLSRESIFRARLNVVRVCESVSGHGRGRTRRCRTSVERQSVTRTCPDLSRLRAPSRPRPAAEAIPPIPPHSFSLGTSLLSASFTGAHRTCKYDALQTYAIVLRGSNRYSGSRTRQGDYNIDGDEVHYPTRPVDKDKAEGELVVNIKKATNPDETAPKQKHVRSA